MYRFRRHLGILSLFLLVGAGIFALPHLTYAQNVVQTGMADFASAAGFGGTSDVRLIIARLLRTALSLSGLVLFGMIVYGGLQWMMANGDKTRIEKARGTLINAVVGIVIILSAFAITQFVISSLVGATNPSSNFDDTTGGPGIPSCPGCPVDYSSLFVTESYGCLETTTSVPKNTQVQILFNRNVPTSQADLAESIRVSVEGVPVPVTLSGAGHTVLIDANTTTCPDDPGSYFCEGTNYTVNVLEGFTSADGVVVDCTIYHPCSQSFTTTDVIDSEGPTVILNVPNNGDPVFSGVPVTLQAQVTDDGSVGLTDFTVDSAFVDSAGPTSCVGDGPMSCLAEGSWTPGTLVLNSTYTLRATATDCAGNVGNSAGVVVTALAPHCANTIQDADETGLNCGGEDCLACSGDACTESVECASSLCEDAVCVDTPRITGVSPGNGAPGNFITIHGSGFGTTQGFVTFLGTTDRNDDAEASVVSCPTPAWSDTQIVVAIPSSAIDGALSVTTAGAVPRTDTTDNDFGPIIADFNVNDIVRPGLCAVSPVSAEAGDRIAIAGENFGTDPTIGTVYFSGSNVYASTFLPTLDTWTDGALSVLVPPSTAGAYALSVFVDGEGSNDLAFLVTAPPVDAEGPSIATINTGVSLCTGDLATERDLCSTDTDCGTGSCQEAFTTATVGQYLTIYGSNFGNTIGTVIFEDSETGPVTFVPDFPAMCAETWWTDTQIVVAVPEMSLDPVFNPKTIRIRRSDYPATTESNQVELTVTDIDRVPGLCAMAPTAGPVGVNVTFYGDDFGASASDFLASFYNNLPAGDEQYVSSQEIAVSVPVGAETGPVSVAVQGVPSNALNFQVGNCNSIPGLCSSSQTCCTNGSCQSDPALCSAPPVASEYAYSFSTGPIPNTPTVVEACDTNAYSPTPSIGWPDGAETCLEAVVQVVFAPGAPAFGMDTGTLLVPDNIYVETCNGTGVDPCESVVSVDGVPVHLSGSRNVTPLSWVLTPSETLAVSTWYRVTVTTNVQNSDGVAMTTPYVFRFRTQADVGDCELTGVQVQPANYTAVTTDTIPYTSLPTAGSCQVLNPDVYSWNWDLENYGHDITFTGNATYVGSTASTIEVHPEEETSSGQPALVTASPVGVSLSDTEELIVEFASPNVTSVMPTCDTACINAQVGATFSMGMTATGTTGLLGAHSTSEGTESNIRLYPCTNEICDVFLDEALNPVVFSNASESDLDGRSFTFQDTLVASTYYRVIIWGGITSETGLPLWGDTLPNGLPAQGLNYGDGQYYSWTFRTRTSAEVCGIGSVSLSPSQAILSVIGERASFSASALGTPDSCAVNGQVLNANSYPWNWIVGSVVNTLTEAQVLMATFLPEHSETATLDTSALGGGVCSGDCLNVGSVAYPAICGNGAIEQGSDGQWEDCDPASPDPQWTPSTCSASCRAVGVTACSATLTSGCCGNGIQEGREECDDGANLDGNGCSASCLNEGATLAGLTCGDGVVSHSNTIFPDGTHSGGEECDDGNRLSGDGCSSVCLREGSTNIANVGSICGNGTIEEGEDCDDGNGVGGDGCSIICLQEPLGTGMQPSPWVFGSTSGICGNSVVEVNNVTGIGEECDGGVWCSDRCLNLGASVFYNTPSFCGNGGEPEVGEECEVGESDGIGPFDPIQTLEIEPIASQTVVNGVAQTFVTADASTTVNDTASISLSCSCESDSDCGSATAIGCGVNGCCFERPAVDENATYPLPTAFGTCLNTLVQTQFNQTMMPEGLFSASNNPQPYVFLELLATDTDGNGLYDPEIDVDISPSNCPAYYVAFDAGAHSGFSRFARSVVRFFFPTAFAQDVTCRAPATLALQVIDTGTPEAPQLVTQVQVQYQSLLEPLKVYRLIVVGDGDLSDAVVEGVTSEWNVTMDGIGSAGGFSNAWYRDFVTGNEVCLVDDVSVIDESSSPGIFTVSGETHRLSSRALSYNGPYLEPITPIEGLYAWEWFGSNEDETWGWTSNDSLPDTLILSSPSEPVPLATDPQGSIMVSTATPAVNGRESIQSRLRISQVGAGVLDTVGRTVSGSLAERVLLCENPWPAVANFPFADTSTFDATNTANINLSSPFTNFSFYYCRDFGDPDTTQDDLPALSVVEKVQNIATPGVFKEFLFPVIDPNNSDALGVRVLENADYLSPSAWFAGQGFVGSPAGETLDGFAGVRDGRTLYASAPNVSTQIYPNMYVVAYNEGASAETMEIYQRILANWQFVADTDPTGELLITNNNLCSTSTAPVLLDGKTVACSSDDDCSSLSVVEDGGPVSIFCDANKDKLRRDLQRLTDVRLMVDELADYGASVRHCSVTKGQSCFQIGDCPGDETCLATVPSLLSGTYIPSITNSTWPSWQAQLSNALGTALPTDPLNLFSQCPDPATSTEGYDPASCYDAINAIASCPADSHVYWYQSIAGESYQLKADLEYGPSEGAVPWSEPIDVTPLGVITIGNAPTQTYEIASSDPTVPDTTGPGGFQTVAYCQDNITWTANQQCGDGHIGQDETCEVGQTVLTECTAHVCSNTVTLSYNGALCDPDASATTIATVCGASGSCVPTGGVKTLACYLPGDTNSPSSAGCNGYQTEAQSTSACVPFFCGDGFVDPNSAEVCDDGPLNGQYGYCGSNCTYDINTSAFCGDGRIAGGEVCDCGYTSALHPSMSVAPACFSSAVGGAPLLNGQYSTSTLLGCSADCSGPPPSCGDAIVNGAEQCDGDVETWAGALCNDGSTCTVNADCATGVCGGLPSTSACTPNSEGIPTARTRVCGATTCAWAVIAPSPGGWGICTASGGCGNGIVEGNEQCDDGNENDNDGCLTDSCLLNVCGDGHRNIGVESCDLGGQNGVPCDPLYNSTCNYCSTTCTFQAVTGGFCGNDVIDTGEYCDGSQIPARCILGNIDPTLRQIGEICDPSNTTNPCPNNPGFTCRTDVGMCNGGSTLDGSVQYNGVPCATNPVSSESLSYFCSSGSCVTQDCNATCSLACPFNLEEGAVLVQNENSSSRSSSVELFSYLSGPAPDEAEFYFPACRVGTEVVADVSLAEVTRPVVDLLFLVDMSNSMNADVNGNYDSENPSRLTILQNGLSQAVETLLSSVDSGQMNISVAMFNRDQSSPFLAENNNTDCSATATSSNCPTAGTVIDFTANTSALVQAIQTMPPAEHGTPTGDGLDWAGQQFFARGMENHRRILVLLSDGVPSEFIPVAATPSTDYFNGWTDDESLLGLPNMDPVLAAYRLAGRLRDQLNIEIFSAAFTASTDTNARGLMCYLSSDTGHENYSSPQNPANCLPGTNGIEYFYTAQTETQFNTMIEDIIDAILSVSVSYVTSTGSVSTPVPEGNNVTLPFPPNFSCQASSPFTIPFFLSFGEDIPGSDPAQISNIRLQYCPFQ